MKNFRNIRKIGLVAVFFALFSCTEDEIGSRVTDYPIITLNDDSLLVLTEGVAFTDPGAIAMEGEEQIPVTTTGTVDANTPGVYFINYSATNVDGYDSSARRTVIVLSSEPSAINLEGTFFRSGFANNITQISDRVYQADNAGGVDPTASANVDNLLNVTFYNIDDQHVYIPYQEDVSNTGIDVESNIGNIINENSFNWILTASAFYGTAQRNFTR